MAGHTLPWLVLVSAGVVLAGLSLLVFAVQIRLISGSVQGGRERCDELEQRLADLLARVSRLDETQAGIARAARSLSVRQDRIESDQPSERPYSHAIDLVKRGASTDDLMRSCGLSLSEAELITMVHGMRTASRAVTPSVRADSGIVG